MHQTGSQGPNARSVSAGRTRLYIRRVQLPAIYTVSYSRAQSASPSSPMVRVTLLTAMKLSCLRLTVISFLSITSFLLPYGHFSMIVVYRLEIIAPGCACS